uniref:Putative secreted protein n=1 Tax=Anopheles darlingi TaxID=43151 RepID=A0A2M4DR74_ANODA
MPSATFTGWTTMFTRSITTLLIIEVHRRRADASLCTAPQRAHAIPFYEHRARTSIIDLPSGRELAQANTKTNRTIQLMA